MKKIIGLLLVSAFAASCINLHGQLNVEQTMNVKKKGGFLNLKTKTVSLAPGAYRTELKVNNQKSFTLKLRLDEKENKEILIPIKSKNEFNLPSNGEFTINGNEIAQPFDVQGTIETSWSTSAQTRTFETCTMTRYERRCEKVCTTHPAGPGSSRVITTCNIICNDVPITVYGERLVEYHYRYTHRDLKTIFVDTESKARLANYSARGTESDRITDYYGECR